jgi:hypothetical protein
VNIHEDEPSGQGPPISGSSPGESLLEQLKSKPTIENAVNLTTIAMQHRLSEIFLILLDDVDVQEPLAEHSQMVSNISLTANQQRADQARLRHNAIEIGTSILRVRIRSGAATLTASD